LDMQQSPAPAPQKDGGHGRSRHGQRQQGQPNNSEGRPGNAATSPTPRDGTTKPTPSKKTPRPEPSYVGFMTAYMEEVAMEANPKQRHAVVARFVQDYSTLFTGQQYKSDLLQAARFEDLPRAARLAFQTALHHQGYDVVPDGAGYSPLSTPPGSPKGTPSSPRRSNPGDYGEEAYPPPPQSTTSAPQEEAYPPPPDMEVDEFPPLPSAREPHPVASSSRPRRDRKAPSEFWVVNGGVQKSGSEASSKKQQGACKGKPRAQAGGPKEP
jgi:hypothetical protein